MTITVNGPNGITINFPDGTDESTINSAFMEALGQKPAAKPAETAQAGLSDYGADILKAIPSGLAKGVTGLVGLPGTIGELGHAGIERVRRLLDPEAKPIEFTTPSLFPSGRTVKETLEKVTGPLYEPKTVPGQYAGTLAEFAPNIALGGPATLGNIARFTVAPALASETAGQATKGSDLEGIARAAAALGTGGAAALIRPGRTATTLREAIPDNITPAMVDDAQALMNEAARQGVRLSFPEAISQVAGRPVLTDLMRQLEAAPQTQARMGTFFGDRPQQVEQAGTAALGGIAAPRAQPSTIGREAGVAAEAQVNEIRELINQHTRPLYQAAERVRLNPQEMAQVRALPGFDDAVTAVRNDPQLNRHVANLPEDSVGFLDAVRQRLNEQARAASSPVAQNRSATRAAGYRRDATDLRTTLTNASPEYDVALQAQQMARQQYLEPLLAGPLGALAKRDITTAKAIDTLFPTNPLPSSQDEIATAVGAVVRRNPNAAGDLVRAHVERTFNEATQNLQSGMNQAGGAKFMAQLAGNAQQRANLQAAIEALPNGQVRWEGFERFLDVMQATGTRQHVGSKTAYNQLFLQEAGRSGTVGEIAKAATNPLQGAKFIADKYETYRRGQNLDELARILTDPRAIPVLRRIAGTDPNTREGVNAARQLMLIANVSSEPLRVTVGGTPETEQ